MGLCRFSPVSLDSVDFGPSALSRAGGPFRSFVSVHMTLNLAHPFLTERVGHFFWSLADRVFSLPFMMCPDELQHPPDRETHSALNAQTETDSREWTGRSQRQTGE